MDLIPMLWIVNKIEIKIKFWKAKNIESKIETRILPENVTHYVYQTRSKLNIINLFYNNI